MNDSKVVLEITFMFLQIRVQVQDGGNPRLSDAVTLDLFVQKNLNPPLFNGEVSPADILITIPESLPKGEIILTLNASDADIYVSIIPKHLLSVTISSCLFVVCFLPNKLSKYSDYSCASCQLGANNCALAVCALDVFCLLLGSMQC